MDKRSIERAARELQRLVWDNRHILWPDVDPDLIAKIHTVDPSAAARLLAINYVEYEELGGFGQGKDRFLVAGMFNRDRNEIAVSRKFGQEVLRFTTAHELGHWVLHQQDRGHRDRPAPGVYQRAGRRDETESEADYFAACFLLPRNLVREEFRARFSPPDDFEIDDHAASLICSDDPDSLLNGYSGRIEGAALLARRTSWNGRQFSSSLVQYFGASALTIAIRLVELELVR